MNCDHVGGSTSSYTSKTHKLIHSFVDPIPLNLFAKTWTIQATRHHGWTETDRIHRVMHQPQRHLPTARVGPTTIGVGPWRFLLVCWGCGTKKTFERKMYGGKFLSSWWFKINQCSIYRNRYTCIISIIGCHPRAGKCKLKARDPLQKSNKMVLAGILGQMPSREQANLDLEKGTSSSKMP